LIMIEIGQSRISKIVTLHNEVASCLRMSVEKAIRIGELLTAQKDSMQHGEFLPWIKANLPFTDRTARNYMAFYANRNLLKSETVSDLSSAYRLLAGDTQSKKPQDDRPKRLNPDDPDYLKQFWIKHRWYRHRLADLSCDLEAAETLEEVVRVRDECLKLQQESAEELFYLEAYLGRLIIELKPLVPAMKEARADALIYIEEGNTVLAGEMGPLPDDIRADVEKLLGGWVEVKNDCEYGLAIAS